ncbi:MAG: winged helix-turn-helix domain-containing protein [Oscillospiraceae bacterium]|nr:winged helix-turn-helix domain-containing protein [Oscillospiraceae bacterium]
MLEIRMFGGFSIKYRGADVSDAINRSKRLRAMLAYLIAHQGREISQGEIIEALWQDDEIENPANTLKTILHRLRSALSGLGIANVASCISYRRGAYAWTPCVPCYVDAHEFEKTFSEAEASKKDGERRAQLYAEAAALYKGGFLPKNALDPWVVPLDGYYRSKFITAVNSAADYFLEHGRASDVVPLCRGAVNVDPYEEHFHSSLIRALIADGRQQQALEHYDYVSALFFNKFGVNLSGELTELYKEVVKSSNKTETNLSVIIDGLREDSVDSGCFYCEYEPFRTIYRLEARSAARSGQVVYICLLTLSDARGKKPKPGTLAKSMDRLRETVIQTLRHGDLFTRYSVNQYLVMLPATSFETGNMVMRRVAAAFRRENGRGTTVLSYTLQPIVPAALEAARLSDIL